MRNTIKIQYLIQSFLLSLAIVLPSMCGAGGPTLGVRNLVSGQEHRTISITGMNLLEIKDQIKRNFGISPLAPLKLIREDGTELRLTDIPPPPEQLEVGFVVGQLDFNMIRVECTKMRRTTWIATYRAACEVTSLAGLLDPADPRNVLGEILGYLHNVTGLPNLPQDLQCTQEEIERMQSLMNVLFPITQLCLDFLNRTKTINTFVQELELPLDPTGATTENELGTLSLVREGSPLEVLTLTREGIRHYGLGDDVLKVKLTFMSDEQLNYNGYLNNKVSSVDISSLAGNIFFLHLRHRVLIQIKDPDGNLYIKRYHSLDGQVGIRSRILLLERIYVELALHNEGTRLSLSEPTMLLL